MYSQDEQFALGVAPTWDNPDILTNYWNPFRLMPQSEVTVRNLSGTATAANTQVQFFTAPFGLGQTRTLLGAMVLTLAPGEERKVYFTFPPSLLGAADQRLGAHVRIIHPYDAKPINNAGSQLLADAYTSAVGRTFSVQFPVVNPQGQSQQISLVVLPNQLSAAVSPAAHVFGPLQQLMATLTLHVPTTVHGTAAAPVRLDATVVGRDAAGVLLDGLTYVIWVDD